MRDDDAGGDVAAGFRQDQGELVAAVASGRVDGARVIAQNFSKAHQRAAAGQMAEAVIDGFESVHIEEHDAERTLSAARAVEFGFETLMRRR